MSSLANQQQNLSFPGLLQVPGGITSTLQQVQDGNGNATGLSLSSTGASVTTSDTSVISDNGTPYPNATPRLISDMFGDTLNILDFGASPANANNLTYIQNAITAAIANGKALYIPSGTYALSGTLNVTAGITFYGDGYSSVLYPNNSTGNLFNITAGGSSGSSLQASAVSFYNLRISSSVLKTAGSALYYDAGATKQNNFSFIDNVYFENQFIAINFVRCAYQRVTNCQFLTNATNGTCISVANATTADAGDQLIAFNQFYGGSGVTCISHVSGGGLRIISNKFVQTAYGYVVNFATSVVTGIGIIANNSFDGMAVSAIHFTVAISASDTDITITGNVFDGSPSDSFMRFTTVSGGGLGRVAITGNTCIQNTGSTPIIDFDFVGTSIISSNLFAGAGTINISSACVNTVVATNSLQGVAINNSSTSTLIFNTVGGATPYTALNGSFLLNTTGTGGGNGVLAIANVLSAPTGGQSGAGVIYVQAGALKYIGSSGTATTIAPA